MAAYFEEIFGDLPQNLSGLLQNMDVDINDKIDSTLPAVIFGNTAPQKHYLIVSTAPSLDAWPRINGHPMTQKAHNFHIRLLEKYGLASIVTGCKQPRPTSKKEDQAWNCLLLEKYRWCNVGHDIMKPDKIELAYALMRDDVKRLWLLFKELLPPHCEAIAADPQAMLQAFACLHLVGRMSYEDLLKSVDALNLRASEASQKAALAFARTMLEKGSFGYDDNSNRLVGKFTKREESAAHESAINLEMWQTRAELRAYQLAGDFSRWLLSDASNWIRERTAANRPIRILVIDPQLHGPVSTEKPTYPYLRLCDRLEMIFLTLFCAEKMPPRLDLIPHEEGILPTPQDILGDSVVAFDEFLATPLRNRVKRVTLSDWAPGKPFPKPAEDAARFPPWKTSALDVDEDWSLWDYDVVFCEVAYEKVYAGPQVVQKLRSFFERTHRPDRDGTRPSYTFGIGHSTRNEIIAADRMPAIIVLTRSANFNFIHQCLSLGAHAYVAKDRLFEIPFRLWAAVRDEEFAALHRAQSYIAGSGKERMGHRSNFRNLYSLHADRITELQRTDRQHLISGAETDRTWIQRLPKADLHRHFGTSIRLKTFEALAFNTVGYLATKFSTSGRPAQAGVPTKAVDGGHLHDAVTLTLVSLIGSAVFRMAQGSRTAHDPRKVQGQSDWERSSYGTPAQLLLSATSWACEKFLEEARKNTKNATWHPGAPLEKEYWRHDKPLQAVIALLAPIGSPIRLYQATSLIVAATKLLRDNRLRGTPGLKPFEAVEHEIKQRWCYLRNIDRWTAMYTTDQRDGAIWREAFVVPAAMECYQQSLATGSAPQQRFEPGGYFTALSQAVEGRIKAAASLLSSELDAAKQLLGEFIKNERGLKGLMKQYGGAEALIEASLQHVPSLAELVINQQSAFDDHKFPQKIGLARYLWGCELLGADHFQFPENLVLGAKDLVEQNAEECVVYSEVRCETPGYTVGGMSAAGATDLLQRSFDLAAAFYRETGGVVESQSSPQSMGSLTLRSQHGATFIRTNILLAAKRHKKREDCASVIGLLERYLSSGPRRFDYSVDPWIIPKWWKPCSVVGFDLSGNEANPAPEIEEEIQRLFKYSSPITIHAGEAATAESVWQAVYRLHARRIGHGLRLRENPNLLKYCINEGICMEMCPVSNVSTHGFLAVTDEQHYVGHASEHYPLRYYMAAGLEVCINTDNRSLHQPVNQPFDVDGEGATITDDYLMAAQLSGGFSRWEVLKLVRAGFKHAFISKVDISELLAAAENRVYTLVAHPNGVDWRPKPWKPPLLVEGSS